MSLAVASRIAYSAVSAAQVQISLVSSNIANADTAGYTVKTGTQVATVSSAGGTGTAISEITSYMNKHVFASLVSADSSLGEATAIGDYTDQLQALLGATSGDDGGGTSIAASITSLETALSGLATSPDNDTAKAEVVSAAGAAADQIRTLSSSIQQLRSDADHDIASDVETINTTLKSIDTMNDAIVLAKSNGQSTADLEDQRNTAIQSIASLININYTTSSTGAVSIYTGSGTVLLNSAVHELSYTPANSVSADTVFTSITVDGKDVTDEISSGAIGGLLTLRDETVVDAQDSLDTLATAMIATLNAITADGSAVPAPNSLTGTVTTATSDAFSATGSVRIAIVDSENALVSSTDLDLSSFTTVSDLIDGLNAISGVSASIDSSGNLTITATDSSAGIAIGALDSAVGSDTASFSSYFGFNSLFTGDDASSIRASTTLTADSSLLATGTLSSSTSPSAGDAMLTTGDATRSDALLLAMSTQQSYAASGGVGAQKVNFADYAAAIVADIADVASQAQTELTAQTTAQSSLSDTISSQSGVNLDEETAKLSQYQTLYSAAAQVMSTVNDMFTAMLEMVKAA